MHDNTDAAPPAIDVRLVKLGRTVAAANMLWLASCRQSTHVAHEVVEVVEVAVTLGKACSSTAGLLRIYRAIAVCSSLRIAVDKAQDGAGGVERLRKRVTHAITPAINDVINSL